MKIVVQIWGGKNDILQNNDVESAILQSKEWKIPYYKVKGRKWLIYKNIETKSANIKNFYDQNIK